MVWGKFFAGGLTSDSKSEANFSRPQIKKKKCENLEHGS
jgi:hypothetical protein